MIPPSECVGALSEVAPVPAFEQVWKATSERGRSIPAAPSHGAAPDHGRDRLSLPFFFDPGWNAEIRPLEAPALRNATTAEDAHERWDQRSVHAFQGTYGDYLLGKVGKVFPELRSEVLSNG